MQNGGQNPFYALLCSDYRGWSCGAMVQGNKFPLPGRPITPGEIRAMGFCMCRARASALAVGAGGGCLDIFSLIIFPPLSGIRPDIDWITVSKGHHTPK